MTQHFTADQVKTLTGCANVSYLGTGSFGETWRVENSGAVTAQKFLHTPGYDVERLAREIEGLGRVNVPEVVHLYGVDDRLLPPGRTVPRLTFEFIDGPDLARWLADGNGPVTGATLKAMAVALLRGVAAMHAVEVVHRDIKPANIALRGGAPDSPVLLDLGLAKLLDVDSITRYPGMIGTFMYASPEQLSGLRARRSADMWALGVVLSEAATGKHPFFTLGERITLSEALARLTAPPALPPDVPTELAALVNSFLHNEPYRRGSAAAALRKLGEGDAR
jgi:serine/threonine protein kinase